MKDVFHPSAVKVVKFVGRNNLYVSQKVGRIFRSGCNTCFNFAASHADFVNQFAVLSHKWVI